MAALGSLPDGESQNLEPDLGDAVADEEFSAVRWRQRFDSFERALATLERTAGAIGADPPSEMEQLALIQCFEFTHELAWKVCKDFLEADGVEDLRGSRSSTQAAIEKRLVGDGETWMDMILSRNRTSHAYDEGEATEIADKVLHKYLAQFRLLRDALAALACQTENRR